MGDHRHWSAAYEAAGTAAPAVFDRRIQVFAGKARSSAPNSSYFATTSTTTNPPRPPHLGDLLTDQPPSPPRVRRSRLPSKWEYYHTSSCSGANSSAVVAYTKSSSSSAPPSAWCFGDPEMKRRKRVAKYKVYAAEGKVKASLQKGLRWIKCKCNEIVHGW